MSTELVLTPNCNLFLLLRNRCVFYAGSVFFLASNVVVIGVTWLCWKCSKPATIL